jgi:putative spermidine/putrescine transport system ATP-binding protein
MTHVSLQGLVKRYGRAAAVDGIALEVESGSFVSLLGPSGCGKTTTLKCIAGFETADEGRILFDGRDVSKLPAERRDIGMVFQSYALFPHLTVAGNLAFGLEMRRTPKDEQARRIAEVLELVRLTGFEARYPRELSGGQQQRVALARALVIRPSILLLDEPLANLDAKLRIEMCDFIRDLQRKVGITTLFVTHDQAEAMTMSDRVVVMFEGRIAQVGAPETIYQHPSSRTVANFVGRSNFLTGRVDGGIGGPWLVTGFGPVALSADLPPPAGPLTVLARPEDIHLMAADAPAADGAPRGTVASAAFRGSYVDYRIAMGDGTEIAVHAPATERFGIGAPVALGFDRRRLWPVGEG